jgi:hypothetical protein
MRERFRAKCLVAGRGEHRLQLIDVLMLGRKQRHGTATSPFGYSARIIISLELGKEAHSEAPRHLFLPAVPGLSRRLAALQA